MGKGRKRELEDARADALNADLQAWWQYARETARRIASNAPAPRHPPVFGPVLEPDEEVRLVANAGYSRLYAAGDGSWSVPGYAVAGNTSIMLGAAVGHRIAISRARAHAADAAQVRWREHQSVQFIATDRRILCNVVERGWLSFWYSGVTEFYPDLDDWSITLCFTGEAGPLRLQGPAVAGLTPWAAHAVLGDRWSTDPRLVRLLH